MFVVRIKFEVQNNNFYETNKIYTLYERDGYKCTYKLVDEDTFEFVLGNFENRDEAFERGKMFYSGLLFLLNANRLPFDLKISDFDQEQLCSGGRHLNRRNGKDEEEPEKFYFSNKKFFNNDNNLEIFEVDKDFYEEYNLLLSERLRVQLHLIGKHDYHFEKLQDIKIPYNKEVYSIYKILDLCNREDEISIQILILSIAIETMANFELEDILQKCESADNLDEQDKVYIKEFCATEREMSVKKKCKLFIKRYLVQTKKALDTFNDLYDLRSAFTHGTDISKNEKIYQIASDGKDLILNLIKAKYSLKSQYQI